MAEDDEAMLFSWIEWPDKATRDAGMEKMMVAAQSDPRFSPKKSPMAFDGKRMIFGGFVPVVKLTRQKNCICKLCRIRVPAS